jgi:thiol:disulfide interchange protein DsbD
MKLIKSLILLLISSNFLFAEIEGMTTEKVINATAQPSKSKLSKGEEFKIQVNLDIADWWYTYGLIEKIGPDGIGPLPTGFIIENNENLEISGEVEAPKPKTKYDDGFNVDIDIYNGDVSFVVTVKALNDIDLTTDSNFVTLDIQVCDTVRCLPPEYVNVYINPENITSNPEAKFVPSKKLKGSDKEVDLDKANTEEFKTESSSEIDKAKEEGTWNFLLFSMLAGLAALTTPCVFPMIPITVSFFTKRAEKANAKSLRDALLFALGIISTFTIIGLVVTLIFGATGVSDLATNPITNFLIAGVFLIFAFNLFGAFEIQIPTGILNKLNAKSQGGGTMGIILMGFTFSLTSFTCTVPFVGSSLLATQGGDYYYPIIGMIGFSSVFSLPFFLLALFPTLMKSMPKSGGWMNNIKVVMGFLEIAAAVKFLSNIDLAFGWELITRDLFIAIWVACGTMIVAYILGGFQFKLDTKLEKVGAIRAVWAVVFTTITIYLFTGLFGKSLGEVDAFLPPADYGNSGASASVFSPAGNSGEKLTWMKDYDKAVAKAKEEGKPLFIDFTGWQCTNCRWMEKNRFPDPEISDLLSGMIRVKLYTDRREEPELSNKQLQIDRFKSIELPLYAIQDPNENILGTKAFTRDKQEFVNFLKSAE